MEDSGGEKEEYEAAFCEDALQEASISESEMDMEMDETPKGDNPTVFTGAAEELDKGHTREPPPRIRNFNGMSLEDLFVIEICAGSARLSKAAHQCGFRTMAVDHSTGRTCGFPICVFDLTDADDLAHLLHFIEESADSILAIWIAPSCGTCSRAREKRLKEFEKAGIKTPIPLRSKEKPDQLDGLSGLDKIKVEKANMLYDAVYTLASLACALHIFVGIENPTNSHYWNTSPMEKLCNEQAHHYVTFHNCAHGAIETNQLPCGSMTPGWIHWQFCATVNMHTSLGRQRLTMELYDLLLQKKLHIQRCCVSALCTAYVIRQLSLGLLLQTQ